MGTKRAFLPLLTAPLILACVFGPAAPASAAKPVSVALVEATGDRRPSPAIGASLLETLSREGGIRLVERELIAHVFDELELSASGLVDPATAVKFGELVSADAFAIVEGMPGAEQASARIRVVETRTGIRLLDRILTAEGSREVEQVVEATVRTLRDLGKGRASRRYVGMVGVHSEEPGRSLDPTAVALGVIIDHDLHSLPEVIVLERRELARLTAERDVTGIEIDLQTSMTLVEGGLRHRGDGQGLVLTLVLTPLAPGVAPAASIELGGRDVVELRREIARRLPAALGEIAAEPAPAEPAVEARHFAERALWLKRNSMATAALPLAEAALALEPSHDHYKLVYQICQDVATARPGTLSDAERFRMDFRAQEADMALLRMTLEAGKPLGTSDYPVRRLFDAAGRDTLLQHGFPTPITEETWRLIDEVNRSVLSKYELVLRERGRDRVRKASLLICYLDHSRWMTVSAEDFAELVRSLQTQFDAEVGNGSVRRTIGDGSYYTWCANLSSRLGGVLGSFDYWTKRPQTPEEAFARLRPLLDWLAAHEDPAMRFLGLSLLARQKDARGEEPARKAMEVLFGELLSRESPSQGSIHQERVCSWVDGLLTGMKNGGHYDAAFERCLRQAEAARDASPLICCPDLLRRIVWGRDTWRERVVFLVNAGSYDPALAPRAALVLEFPDFKRSYEQWRRQARGRQELWDQYVIKPISITNRTGDHARLIHLHVEDTPETRDTDEPLWFFWRNRPGEDATVIVTRLGVEGGRMREVLRLRNHGGGINDVVTTPDSVFIAWSWHGITMIRDGQAVLFREPEGVPGAEVQKLEWLDGRLYLALRAGVARFDPDTKRFKLLASSRSVNTRHGLDGGEPYHIHAMVADRQRHCLWLAVVLPPRDGIWKYSPVEDTFERLPESGFLRELVWNDEVLLFRHGDVSLSQFDPATGEISLIPGYKSVPRALGDGQPDMVALGRHIISGHGIDGYTLSTPDEHAARPAGTHDWNIVRRLGWGFIAGYQGDGAADLWYAKRISREGNLSPSH